jgi:hypothetical protein
MIACFYSTNLRTYILYILFVSIFTIKYILLFPIRVNNIHLPVSKICEPPDLFLSPRRLAEFQERFLRCGIRTARTAFRLIGAWQSRRSTTPSSLPSTRSYISFVLFRQAIPLPKKATGRSRRIYWTPPSGKTESGNNGLLVTISANYCKLLSITCITELPQLGQFGEVPLVIPR